MLPLLRFLKLISRIIPRQMAVAVAKTAANIYLIFNTKTKRVLNSNSREIFGRNDIAKEMLSNYFITLFDFLKSGKTGYIEYLFGNDIDYSRIENQLKKNNGLIALTPHFGFWEAGPLILLLRGLKTNVIYQPYENPKHSAFFNSIRSNKINWLPVKNAAKEALNALKRNEILATAIDIDYSENGIYVPFLSGKMRIPLGPAVLSYHLGTPILMCYARMLENKKYKAEFEDIIYPNQYNEKNSEIERMCREIASCMEKKIKRHPEQWFIFKEIDKI